MAVHCAGCFYYLVFAAERFSSINHRFCGKKPIATKTRSDGSTALHVAVAGDWPKAVRFLLSRGAQADKEDTRGFTPLSLARQLGREDLLGMLQCPSTITTNLNSTHNDRSMRSAEQHAEIIAAKESFANNSIAKVASKGSSRAMNFDDSLFKVAAARSQSNNKGTSLQAGAPYPRRVTIHKYQEHLTATGGKLIALPSSFEELVKLAGEHP